MHPLLTALYTYDRMLSFDREVDLVWRRPRGHRRSQVVTLLYGLMQICTPIHFLLNIATICDLGCKVSRQYVLAI